MGGRENAASENGYPFLVKSRTIGIKYMYLTTCWYRRLAVRSSLGDLLLDSYFINPTPMMVFGSRTAFIP